MTMTAEAIKRLANDYANQEIARGDDSAARDLSYSHDIGVISDAEFAATAELAQTYIQCRQGYITRTECSRRQKEILAAYREAVTEYA